jgi:hypothetical protein
MKRVPDEYDTFGEYVAMELRSMSSDTYRRMPKKEIHQPTACIAEPDDLNTLATCTNSKVHDAPLLDPQPTYPVACLSLKDCLLFLLLLLELFSSL